ncbi:MAG: Vacuolar protein-sorting-associated protein 24 [Claussenomyces sp. TS43310]|nr:MAG: Vacuolar protein-sorting-associated protein 24 [Claussenomyces sp. TS43310]
MESIRAVFFKPDPQAQARKCNSLIRANVRKLDRDIAQLKAVENKTKDLIRQASRRGQRNPSQAKHAQAETRTYARELIRVRKTASRLITSKAQLNSVSMQVTEAFAVRKIEGSLKASTGIMKDVNALVRLPELMGTMQALGSELVKAGIMEEMIDDALPMGEVVDEEEEEAESEVDKVLGEILKDRMGKAGPAPAEAVPAAPVQEEIEEDDQEEILNQMRGRLEALKS